MFTDDVSNQNERTLAPEKSNSWKITSVKVIATVSVFTEFEFEIYNKLYDVKDIFSNIT